MKGRGRALSILLVGGALVLGLIARDRVRLNWSDSAPHGIYIVSREPIRRGAWVRLCPPIQIAGMGLERGYLARGRCPGGTTELLKLVAALPGDTVEVTDEGVSVNGRTLPGSTRLDWDRAGRRVPGIEPGVYLVPPDLVWLVTPRDRSWDSRYWGPVPLGAVRSTMRRLTISGKSRAGG